MYEEYQQNQAESAFEKAYIRGRRQLFSLNPLKRRYNRILTLAAVLEHASYQSESYVGAQEISVRRIIGTEDRSSEYSKDFYPLHKRMKRNWSTIHRMMGEGTIFDPIKVIEYGGYYFVRDGNHRVSAAKYQGREYIASEVVRYSLPFSLPRNLHWGNLTLLEEKNRFHKHTHAFEVLPESEFYVRCPHSWRWLTTEICTYNRAWFIRKFNRPPESMEEQLQSWYKNLYQNAISYIRKNSLTYLFPGKLETDIFIEMIKLWNSFDNPDSLWLGELYEIFIKKHQRFRLIRTPFQRLHKMVKSLFLGAEDEYRRFAEISQIEELVPEYTPIRGSKKFYSFLYSQLIHSYAPHLKSFYGRAPYIQELTVDWYNNIYAPVLDAYLKADMEENIETTKNSAPGQDFPQAYIRFCTRYYKRILSGEITMEAALREYFLL